MCRCSRRPPRSWLILFACPFLTNNTAILIVMALILGCYWAVGSNLTIKPTQELTDGAGFCIAHQQMSACVLLMGRGRMSKKGKKKSKRIEDIGASGLHVPFSENMVCTSLLMLLFFGGILMVLGKDYLITAGFMKEGQSFLFYIITVCLNFAVYLAILQLGVRTFVTELTQSFQGIADKLLPGSVPGVDCAVTYGFGSPNAVPLGFLAGAVGQFLAIGVLILLKSPVLVIAGFVPVFFDNATIAVYANNKGGMKAALVLPFISGLCQVFGSAYRYWVGMAPTAVIWECSTGRFCGRP